MKKLFFLLALLSLFACQKDEVIKPSLIPVTIEAYCYSSTPELIDFNVVLQFGENINIESKSFELKNTEVQLIYSKTVYITVNDRIEVNTECSKLNQSAIYFRVYSDPGYNQFIEFREKITVNLLKSDINYIEIK